MVPDSSISFKWFLISSTNGGGIHLKRGIMSYFLLYAQWNGYSLTLLDPTRTHHGIQPGAGKLHPLALGSTNPGHFKSNSSNNFPCLCLTISLGVWESCDSSAHSHNCSPSGFQAQAMQLLPWRLRFSYGGFMSMLYCSVPLQLLSYCLSSILCMYSV